MNREQWIDDGLLVLMASSAISVFELGKSITSDPENKSFYLFQHYILVAYDLAVFFALLKIFEAEEGTETEEEIENQVLETMGILFLVPTLIIYK